MSKHILHTYTRCISATNILITLKASKTFWLPWIHIMKGNTGTHVGETASIHEPLLGHASAGVRLGSHGHKGLLLKVLAGTILVLFLFSALFVALCGAFCGQDDHQSSQKSVAFFSSHKLNVGNWLSTGYENLYVNIVELQAICANACHFANYFTELATVSGSLPGVLERHEIIDDIITARTVKTGSEADMYSSKSAVSNTLSRGAWKRSTFPRAKLVSFMKIVHDLTREGLLQRHQRLLCLDFGAQEKVLALRKRGFNSVEGIDISPTLSISNQVETNTLEAMLADRSFDFVFTALFDRMSEPAWFVAEIERSLKVGGFAAMHVSLSVWRDKYITSKPGKGAKPVTLLFKSSEIVYVSTAYAPGLDTVIVFKKMGHEGKAGGQGQVDSKQLNRVSQPVVHRSRYLQIFECKKCVKEQQAADGV